MVLLILAKISCWPYLFEYEPTQRCQNPSQILLKCSPEPPKSSWILMKLTSDGTRSLLGDYVGHLIEKNLIFNAKKSLRGAQKPPGDPELEWNLRWISTLFASFFLCYFSTNFALIFRGSEPEKCGSRRGETLFFIKLTFSKKVLEITNFGTHLERKNVKNPLKNWFTNSITFFSLFFAFF